MAHVGLLRWPWSKQIPTECFARPLDHPSVAPLRFGFSRWSDGRHIDKLSATVFHPHQVVLDAHPARHQGHRSTQGTASAELHSEFLRNVAVHFVPKHEEKQLQVSHWQVRLEENKHAQHPCNTSGFVSLTPELLLQRLEPCHEGPWAMGTLRRASHTEHTS